MDDIRKYLEEELKLSDDCVERFMADMSHHRDISVEFSKWIKQRNYDFDNPVTVEGYTAKSIAELAPLKSKRGCLWVFGLMVALRERPQEMKDYIKGTYL